MKRLWIPLLVSITIATPLWAYTRSWNESAPSDGSAANLLGQVIRQHKQDVRERLQTCMNIGTPTDTGQPKLTSCWVLIGLHSNRPSASVDGQFYYSTDKDYLAIASNGQWQPFKVCQTDGCLMNGTMVMTGAHSVGIDFSGGTYVSAPMLLNASDLSGSPSGSGILWHSTANSDGRLYWTGTAFRFCSVNSGTYTVLTPGSATLTTGSGGC